MTQAKRPPFWEKSLLEWMQWGMDWSTLAEALRPETRRMVFDDCIRAILWYLRRDCPRDERPLLEALAAEAKTPPEPLTVADMVLDRLEADRYDGLSNEECGCGCDVDAIAPCNGGCPPEVCRAAYAWEMLDGTTWYALERPEGAVGRVKKRDG